MTDYPVWLTSVELAECAGISPRKARSALSLAAEGFGWRGQQLVVRRTRGKGGKSGWQYQVRFDSLPLDLRTSYSLPAKQEATTLATEGVEWRYSVIEPALRCKPRTAERANAVRQIASQIHTKPGGRRAHISETTVRDWLKRYDELGPRGLAFKQRSDKGKRRVLISQRWDKGVQLPDGAKQSIAAKLEERIRSLWASLQPSSGWVEVQRHASTTLLRLTQDAQPNYPQSKLKSLCRVPRHLIEQHREYRAVAVHDKDHKLYFDKLMPRISRNTSNLLPLQLVMGDVHPIDVYYSRPDGSSATPKGIFWMDVATERLWCLPVFFTKGRGVRQEDVIRAFVGMAQDPTWGAPGGLYLDNGGEYNWWELVADAMALSIKIHLAEEDNRTPTSKRAVTLAQPYNAPAKGLLEGCFAALERKYFSKIPGWIGGDRTRKKTANVGKEPVAFPHSEAALIEAIQNAVKIYNDTPRGGRLNNLSPNEKLRQFINGGWQPTRFGEGALEAVFCKKERRRVLQGRIQHEGISYYHDKLTDPIIGDWIEARIPSFGDEKRIAVFDRRGIFVCVATPDVAFDHDDPSGAIESARRKTLGRQNIKSMKAKTHPIDTLRLLQDEAEQVEAMPSPAAGAVIRFDDETEAAGKSLAEPIARTSKRISDHERERAEHRALMARMKRVIGGNQ